MAHDIAFLHTASEHVATFDGLMKDLAPHLSVRHDVDARLLAEARMAGDIGPGLALRIGRAMLNAASSGASVVVCTCSTIGSVAERAGQRSDLTTQRIDRPMADAAVALGSRILIVATLHSTIMPTRELIASSAVRLGKVVSLTDTVVEDAWYYFQRSRHEIYTERVVTAIREGARGADVVVLAQASMAPAAELCQDLEIPVLASPRLGVEAAKVAIGQ